MSAGQQKRSEDHDTPPESQRHERQVARSERHERVDAESEPSPDQSTSPSDQPLDECLRELETDAERGLSQQQAERRLHEYGPNSLSEDEDPLWKKILSHFWGPIPWMIEAAVILSAIAQRWEDFAVITTMLFINGGVGFWHESKSDKAIEALKSRLAPEATVLRDGHKQTIDAAQLVPGDIVELDMGQVAPADVRLLEDQHVSMDESALTGESLPVDKEGGDSAYSGTSVKRGSGLAVVVATGTRTRFSKTAELVETAERTPHFQQAVLRIGYFLIGATAVLVAMVIFVTWLMRGNPWDQVLIFALALTLAGIPQALPAVLSVTMSVGASRLAQKKAIVSELAAMEEIAGLEVLCADKTGTLTLNQLQVQDPVAIEADDENELMVLAALTCEKEGDDPIDEAVLGALSDEQRKRSDDYQVDEFRPFDPTRKRAEADVSCEGTSATVAKGAPQVLLDVVEANDDLRKRVSERVDELGERGFRAIGVARRSNDEQWSYLGLLPLLDPPRDDAADVLKDAQEHGIDIRMVTGDHPAIGRQVAGQVGLGSNVIAARDIFSEKSQGTRRSSDEVLQADGFAEVTPEDKFNIIEKFQSRDRIVGMTGDGVNDAPALQQADVGIAVAGATDAARAASSLVLTEPGLGVITHAVEQARRIFERMKSYATFRITETMRVLLFISAAILAYDFFPVTPIMIVLLAILNDIPIMTVAWDNAPTPKTPVRWNMPRILSAATALSVSGVATSFLLLWYLHGNLEQGQLQTAIFLKLLVAGHFTLYLTRNEGWPWQRPWPSLPLFLALESTQVLGTLVAIFGVLVTPISWQLALGIWAYSLVAELVCNGFKVLTYKILGPEYEADAERRGAGRFMSRKREANT